MSKLERYILDTYEGIRTLTCRMAETAARGEWRQLEQLDDACQELFRELPHWDHGQPGCAEYQSRKACLIQAILDHDARIREYVEPQLTDLRYLLGASAQARRVDKLYGGAA